jgi:hypothetical protein
VKHYQIIKYRELFRCEGVHHTVAVGGHHLRRGELK